MTITWYVVLILVIISIILGISISSNIKIFFKSILKKAPIIKKYWMFVMLFVTVLIVSYLSVFKYSTAQDLSNNLNVLGQFATLVFAIFIGYFAFLQVVEGRFEKIKEQALFYFKDKSYLRAKEYYEQALSINQNNFQLLSELLEVLIINNDFKGFDERIDKLEKITMESREKIICFYLKITKSLFKQELLVAKSEINEFISFVCQNKSLLNRRVWDFSDIKTSDTYKKLNGEAKMIFDNFINYITNSLNDNQKKIFEGGDYTLGMLKLTQE